MKLFVSIILLSILIFGYRKCPAGEKGVTTVGTSAVSETVSDIMARQILGAKIQDQ
jgi:hypothetical protein